MITTAQTLTHWKQWLSMKSVLKEWKLTECIFDHFEETVKEDAEVQKMIEQKDLDGIEQYILQNIFEKPQEYYNLEKLQLNESWL